MKRRRRRTDEGDFNELLVVAGKLRSPHWPYLCSFVREESRKEIGVLKSQDG